MDLSLVQLGMPKLLENPEFIIFYCHTLGGNKFQLLSSILCFNPSDYTHQDFNSLLKAEVFGCPLKEEAKIIEQKKMLGNNLNCTTVTCTPYDFAKLGYRSQSTAPTLTIPSRDSAIRI